MVITVLLVKIGEPLKISPDPAFVPRGQQIRWVFAVMDKSITQTRLGWKIYFDGANPFNAKGGASFDWTSPYFSSGLEDSSIIPGEANAPGDYKYGIQVVDIRHGQVLGDDDPYLIVR